MLNQLYEIYDSFTKLDGTSKFYVTLCIGLFAFLYKTFLGMYSDDDKQIQPIRIKTGEMLGKIEAAIIVYQMGDKSQSALDKLIEKLGEGYCYLSWEVKQKLRLYYVNRSDAALNTLKRVIASELDSYPTFGGKPLLIDQIFALIAKVIRPFFPMISIVLIVLLFGAFISEFSEIDFTSYKINIVAKYFALLLSGLIFLSIFNILIEGKIRRSLGIKPWAYTFGIIVVPFIFLAIKPSLISLAIFLQFYLVKLLARTSKSK
ncbi:hypothetical protein WMW72_20600 [Paenibacillus filicis]|uniref:DUF1189 domain-containing protein n=1 Tax=Paenibacillus filicis TaxID=669464 RepID=A0ABU9DN57_9BACL